MPGGRHDSNFYIAHPLAIALFWGDAGIQTQMSFPDTRHSAIAGLHEQDESVRRQSYESVISAYWQPIHRYLCLRWRETDENGADLTQAFFTKALESGTLTSYDSAKGTFRTYLRTCVDRFALNARKRASRAQFLPLDFDAAADATTPEEIFQHEWMRSLFSLVVEDLRTGCDDLRFRVFESYDLNESEVPWTYAELASQFQVSTVTITNYLAAMRRDFRKALLKRLRELTATEREFRMEAREIFGVEI
jgi:DNA-directed RNA polymerase specialized sigma24 family protein